MSRLNAGSARSRKLIATGIVAVLAAIAVVVAVRAGDDGPLQAPSGERRGLDGRGFAAATAEGRQLVPGTALTLAFDDGELSAGAGCNSGGGPYGIDGDRLDVPEFTHTLMGCVAPGIEEQETWFFDWLSQRPRITVEADAVSLARKGVTVRFTEDGRGQMKDRIAGATWTLHTVSAGSGGDVTQVPMPRPTLTIDPSGQVVLFAGCNRGGGTATIGDDEIEFGPIATTRRACRGSAGEVERHVLTVLHGTAAIDDVRAGSLVLSRGGTVLGFRAG